MINQISNSRRMCSCAVASVFIICSHIRLRMQVGQPELISLEKALKEAMVPSGTAREVIGMSYAYCLSVSINYLQLEVLNISVYVRLIMEERYLHLT